MPAVELAAVAAGSPGLSLTCSIAVLEHQRQPPAGVQSQPLVAWWKRGWPFERCFVCYVIVVELMML